MVLIILKQTLTMALYMLVGYLMFKSGKITAEGSRSFANLLAWIVIPSTIINGFLVEFSAARLMAFLISLGLGALTLFISVAISAVVFRSSGVDQFAATFSNAGFIGIPLIRAAIGEDGVFYLVGLLVAFNMLQWSFGANLLLRDKKNTARADAGTAPDIPKMGIKDVFWNPMVISSAVGLLIFVPGFGAKVPAVISNCVSGIASVNAPIAMIVLGAYLAESGILVLFTDKRLYLVSAVRLLLIPAVIVFVLALIPADPRIKMTMVIAWAAPVGVNVAVYSQIYDADYIYACRTVTQSTLLSSVFMPLMILLAELFIHI